MNSNKLRDPFRLRLENKVIAFTQALFATTPKTRSARLPALLIICSILFGASQATADTKEAGEIVVVLLPAAALYAAMAKEEDHTGTLQFVKSFAVSQLLTEVLKQTINKERPSGSCCTAFPSGHASKAFSAAGFIHRRYGDRYAIPAYLAASFVAYSRVESNRHDEIDVLAGAALGWLSSRYFTTPFEGISIKPMLSADHVGIELALQF